MNHPIQPLALDSNGTMRFKENAIVSFLLEYSRKNGVGLNELASMPFPAEDRIQLAQLIGYSLSGFGELSYVDDDSYRAAKLMAAGRSEADARIESLTIELNKLREQLRAPMACLFGVHPDDLKKNG